MQLPGDSNSAASCGPISRSVSRIVKLSSGASAGGIICIFRRMFSSVVHMKAVFGPVYARMQEESRGLLGDDENSIGMEIMEMLGDIPPVSVFMFMPDALPVHPEDFVDDLLRQVHDAGALPHQAP